MNNQSLCEKDMLQDAIMTEKQVSQAYNTSVIESANQEVLKVLQHIETEEQNHAQLFFEAMNKRGWYNVEAAHQGPQANAQLKQQIEGQMNNTQVQMEQTNQIK